MARLIRALIPKTSGQGVSRYSYQQAYSLGQRGKGGGPLKLDASLTKLGQGRPPKADKPPTAATNWNISYGDTWGDGTV